jgi:ABC-type branched-subunit amino acid transport system substrate-binding protein
MKMKNRIMLLIIGVIAFCSMAGEMLLAGTNPLVIGSIGPRTGWGGVYAEDGMDFRLAYAKYINQRGGINGRLIKIVDYDNETKAETTYLYVKKLIEQDKVHVIIGPTFSANCLAAVQAAKYQGVPLIYETPMEPPKEVFEQGSNIFSIDAPGSRYFYASIKLLHERFGVKKLAILATSDESGQEDLDWVKAAVKETPGMDIVIEQRIDPSAIDAMPQLTKIKGSYPDALQLAGSGTSIGPIVKGFAMLGMKVPVVGSTGYVSAETFNLIKGYEPEILIMPTMRPQSAGFGALPAGHPMIEISERMVDVWMAEHGEKRGTKQQILTGWMGWSIDMMDLIIEAVKQAEPFPDDIEAGRKALNHSLENNITDLEQMLGKRSMTPTNHIGLRTTEDVIFLTVKKGKVTKFE